MTAIITDESPQRTKENSKTRATAQAVAQYCDSLVAQAIEPTYDLLSKHFKASNSTIAAHLKGWQQTRPDTSLWLMPTEIQKHSEEVLQTVWASVCKIAQSKLACETLELKQKLHIAQTQINSYEEANQALEEQLFETTTNFRLVEMQALAMGQLKIKLEQIEKQFELLNEQHRELLSVHEKKLRELHNSEIEQAHLLGLLEGFSGVNKNKKNTVEISGGDVQ